MKKKIGFMLVVLLGFFLSDLFPTLTEAAEGNAGKSVQVQTIGEIMFTSESSGEVSSESVSSSTSTSTSISSSSISKDAVSSSSPGILGGKLPNTGEIGRVSFIVLGILLLVLFVVFQRRKRTGNDERGED